MPPVRVPDKGLPPWGKGPKPPEFDGWKRGDPLPEDWDPSDRISIPRPVDPTPVEDEDTTPALNDFKTLASYLSSIGLSDLFTMTGDTPGGWLWEQVKNGVTSVEQLLIGLQETDTFQQRFPLIKFQQDLNASGTPTRVWTPSELLQYEEQLTNTFRRAGLPEWFYDNAVEDIQGRLMSGLSVDAIEERINVAYEYVSNAPPEVMQKFTEYYGLKDAEGALASYILDPEKTIQSINRASRTAYAGGIGARYGFNVDQGTAQRIGELPMSEAGIDDTFQTVAASRGLSMESVGERTDITEADLISAEFDQNVSARNALERRRISRGAINVAGQGGAALTQQGVIGL